MCGPGVYWCDIFARVVGRLIGQIRHGLARVLCRLTEHFKLASGTHETMAVTHIKELYRKAFRIAVEQVLSRTRVAADLGIGKSTRGH